MSMLRFGYLFLKKPYLLLMSFYEVTDETQVRKAVKYAKENCEGLNTVVNCAGVGLAMKTLGKGNKVHPLAKFEMVVKVCTINFFQKF